MAQATSRETVGLSVVDKLRMLLDITKTISRSLDLQEVLNLVMDTLDSLIPYDAAGIYLVKHLRPTGLAGGRRRNLPSFTPKPCAAMTSRTCRSCT
jgi:transcriptional regulator with GAF, ATPase, and Fis domain